jgi:signal transduction histidine kinase
MDAASTNGALRTLRGGTLTLGGLSVVVFIGGWLWYRPPRAGEALVAATAAALALVLVQLGRRFTDRVLFPARAQYRPSVERLSEALAFTADESTVAATIESVTRRALRCGWVEVSCDGSATPPATPNATRLLVPITFRGERLGHIAASEKTDAATFTSEDRHLLQAIASQAALALAYARIYGELEVRRRREAAAQQGERGYVIDTLAGEAAHELRYPINFLKSVVRRARDEVSTLDEEEIEIGLEEAARLERLVAGLDRLGKAALSPRSIDVGELVTRAQALLRDRLGVRRLAFTHDGPPGIVCDPDQLLQLLMNLLSNAIEATAPLPDPHVGVSWTATPRGGELCVWDDGPGFSGPASRLFSPWFTTKPAGTGLGLAVARRIAEAHGFALRYERPARRTHFIVAVPTGALAGREVGP